MRRPRRLLIVSLLSGLVASGAGAQELNFRAVAPRRLEVRTEARAEPRAEPRPESKVDSIPVTVTRPAPIVRAQASDPPPPPSAWPAIPVPGFTSPSPMAPAFAEPCPTGERFWFGADYLYWWISEASAPPLVTASPSGTKLSTAGVLGQPSTSTLFSGNINQDGQSGFRLYGGGWLGPDSNIGFGFDTFSLAGSSTNAAFGSSGAPGSSILARPFINAQNSAEAAQLVAVPGLSTGSVDVSSSTDFWGFELNAYGRPNPTSGLRFLGGFRYLNLNDDLEVLTQTNTVAPRGATFLGTSLPPGSTMFVGDQFNASNQFYGAQAGVSYKIGYGRFSVDLVGKVALGVTDQSITINGATSAFAPAGAANIPGGLLAVNTNMGNLSQNVFGIVPEGRIQVNFKVTNNVALYAGYTVIYWNSVVRGAEQIDRTVNPTQVPSNPAFAGAVLGPARPTAVMQTSNMWAQGVNLGVLFTY